jgi:5-formyltetrahydrofolate cyclo-ligase
MSEETDVRPYPDKDELREDHKRFRQSLTSEQVEEASRAVAHRLISFPPFMAAATILAYSPVNGEISPQPALRLREELMGSAASTIAYPRVTGKREMEARITEAEALEKGALGIPEPNVIAKFIDPIDIDVVLVPGIAFNRQGFRIGYGKGFYDTYLSRLSRNAVTVGLAYDESIVEHLPFEVHDVAVDFVATPERIITC